MTIKEKNQDGVEGCTVSHPHHDDLIAHVRANMPQDAVLENLADLFKALSDPTRVRILWALSLHDMCVCDLADAVGMTQSAISHQLRLLKNAKLVRARRDGRSMIYALADAHVSLLFSQGFEHVQEKEGGA